jgi:hypothetical protein
VRRTALHVDALAQISYMARGSGSAPVGDGTPLPSSLSVVHALHPRIHTVTVQHPARSAPSRSYMLSPRARCHFSLQRTWRPWRAPLLTFFRPGHFPSNTWWFGPPSLALAGWGGRSMASSPLAHPPFDGRRLGAWGPSLRLRCGIW